MSDIDTLVKRQRKIARTIIRLKHSLRADDEIDAFLVDQRQALSSGVMPQLDTSLEDILEANNEG